MKHNLFETGRKFTVIEPVEDSTYTVGSTGFFSLVEEVDNYYMNLASVKAVMTRRGKGGKERIEVVRMFFPIFPVDNENFQKLMPKKGVRRRYVNVMPEGQRIENVMALSDIDFLGWAVAYVKRMYFMIEKCKHHQWPGHNSHMFNRFQHAHEYFEDDPDEYKMRYCSEEKRLEFLDALRPMMSSLVRINLAEAISRADILLTAAEFLEFTNSGGFIPKDAKKKENEFRFTEDEKSLQLLVTKHKKLKDRLVNLSKNKAKNS